MADLFKRRTNYTPALVVLVTAAAAALYLVTRRAAEMPPDAAAPGPAAAAPAAAAPSAAQPPRAQDRPAAPPGVDADVARKPRPASEPSASAPGASAAPAPGPSVRDPAVESLPPPAVLPGQVVQHVIQPGQTLARIANEYKVTEGLLASLNNLTDRGRIRAGERIKVVQGPYHAVIDKQAYRMDILLGDQLVRSFRVGLGAQDGTPTGVWRVFNKLTNPAWTDPRTGKRYAADDPANPIGEHWLGLEGLSGNAVGQLGFGIHGTIEPETIGSNASLGCIRMLPADVAAVFDYLVEGHSTVVVR